MKILITGNMGYIGPVVCKLLRSNYPGSTLLGFDTGYFANAHTSKFFPEIFVDVQYFRDLRLADQSIFNGVDVVIHLASISNDPMGNQFEAVTYDVNEAATINFAKLAKQNGVKKFIFASSCSVYGLADGDYRVETDLLNPQTAYAKSKINIEGALNNIACQDFVITSLRFATACGMSDRLRLDLVLNDFVASAVTTGEVEILSDGTPWRPLISVDDMARAINWAIERDISNGGVALSVNIGSDDWNYQIKDLAYAVSQVMPNVIVKIGDSTSIDSRSYKVSFALFRELAPEFQPQAKLSDVIQKLVTGINNISGISKNFRDSDYIRLNMLKNHISANRLSEKLFWKTGGKND